MRHTDIAIIGGGLAGSTAAAMLGRAGISAILIDPHQVYPFDFRCEKLDGFQAGILRKTGLLDDVLRATTRDVGGAWVARFGRMIDKRPSDQNGIFYDALVNTMRRLVPSCVDFIEAKATAVETSNDRQTITLSDGEKISARLIVLSNGLNIGLRHTLGIERDVISPCHSITVGFNLVPVGRDKFDFPAMSYFTENAAAQMAYITLFPIGEAMRANLIVYRNMDDPWLRRMRQTPEDALDEIMPNFRKLAGNFKVDDTIRIRPADLYVTRGHRQAGIVLIGDAFGTSCPGAGTGTGKVFMDVERLCSAYIPSWLASEGMDIDKISQFYDDPEKRENDARSLREAFDLRSMSTDTGLMWHARRWARFTARLCLGIFRTIRETVSPRRFASQ
ncbi:MAG: FAD-dependent monooxygenase [Afipia sp.]|nr:FAD-dependent monooxygenase [Afipia sp.]